MKVSVQDLIGIKNLLNFKIPNSHFLASLRNFSKSAVFVIDSEELTSIQADSSSLSETSKYRLEAWLNQIKPTLAFAKVGADCEIALLPAGSDDFAIDLLVENPEYLRFEDDHSRPIYAGESREAIFSRKIGYLLGFTKKIIYLDQFFHEQLLQPRGSSGAWYFLEQLLKSGLTNIEIQTTATFPREFKQDYARKSGREFRDHAARASDFQAAFDSKQLLTGIQEIKRETQSKADVRIKVFRKGLGGIPHDRFGMLKMNSDNPVYFYIGPGMNIFRYQLAKEAVSTMDEIRTSTPIEIARVSQNLVLFAEIKA